MYPVWKCTVFTAVHDGRRDVYTLREDAGGGCDRRQTTTIQFYPAEMRSESGLIDGGPFDNADTAVACQMSRSLRCLRRLTRNEGSGG